MTFQEIYLACLFAFGSVVCYERMQYSDSDGSCKLKIICCLTFYLEEQLWTDQQGWLI